MKLIENILYLDKVDVLEAALTTEGYLWKINNKGQRGWMAITDPANGKNIIVPYEQLSGDNKKKYQERFGNPYEMVVRQPLLEMVRQDYKAEDFFKKYTYDERKFLTIQTVYKYTRAASWLNMLSQKIDRNLIKQLGLSTIPDFYTHCAALIEIEKGNGESETYTGAHQLPKRFPNSYKSLLEKVAVYKEKGYDCIISPLYGNKLAAKIGKNDGGFDPERERQQIAVIRRIARMHNNFDAAQVALFSNTIFEKNGWEKIGDSRVYQIMQQHKPILTPGRRGKRAYNSEIAMQIKREAPKFPTYYFTLDGWTTELLYQEGNTYNNRLVIVVVLDAMNKYPVGYAIGDRENTELIRQANRNAILHLKELFGDYYKPYQLQSDNYGIKNLTPFYQAVAHLSTPAAVGNAKSKIIEPYFRHLNKTYCQRMANWSGFGITSRKENQVNTEVLNLTKKNFPDKAGVIRQLVMMMNTERSQKIGAYVAGWNAMPEDHKITMSRIDWIMAFGVEHKQTNTITGQGVIATLNGIKITYDSFDPAFRKNLHLDWKLIYEPEDLAQVLAVSPDGKLRFVLDQKLAIPMDIRSTLPEHNAYRSQVSDYNKAQVAHITKTYIEDAEIVDEILSNNPLELTSRTEADLKLMFTYGGQQKETLQNAKGLKQVQQREQKQIATEQKQEEHNWNAIQLQYLQSKTDFNQYQD
jgi:hypothetical protein